MFKLELPDKASILLRVIYVFCTVDVWNTTSFNEVQYYYE
jgi:hypothetical protein